jgi:hypothetical protein
MWMMQNRVSLSTVKYLLDDAASDTNRAGIVYQYGYGGSMYQQVSDAGAEFKHWNLRGDLVA